MGRHTVYNNITTPEKVAVCNKKNIELGEEFLDYLKSIDRAETTIEQYASDLRIFWCWNHDFNEDKDFVKITKREFAKMQKHCLEVWGWSSQRIRRFKAVISSLSNYIEAILDDEPEFEGYRSSIKKIESPVSQPVRQKSVFEVEEIERLLQHLVENKMYMKACCLALMAYSGRRKSEIPRFKVSFFDEKNVLFGSLYKSDETIKTKGRGKGKFINVYVLKNQFDPYLKLWMDERKELGIESEWLFPRRDSDGWKDEPMTTTLIDNWTDEFSEYLGKPWYAHSMRHMFTTYLAKNNIPTNVIQDIVNWQSADMVNLYTDLTADETIGKYFDEKGIKQVEAGNVSDL